MTPLGQHGGLVTPARYRPAFTLVELVLGIVITSILLGALSSALLLASHALPGQNKTTDRTAEAGRVLDDIASELQYAVQIVERSGRAITFTVPDRNGDGSPERIRYAWSGTAGDPLTRQYNAGSAYAVLPAVHQFSLGYDLQSNTETCPGPPVESEEAIVSYWMTAVSRKDYDVTASKWIGQYFTPASLRFPVASLATWRLTRVLFLAKKDGPTDGQVLVQIRTPNSDGTPTSTVLEERTLYENTLTDSYAWVEFPFDNVTGLGPSDGLCLVLRWGSGGANVSRIRYEDAAGSGRLITSDAGQSWSYSSSKSMYYFAYGKVITPGPVQTVTRQYITGVRISLQAGAESDARLDVGARLVNAPELLTAVWETELSSNPTTLDMNGDGVGDWVRTDCQAFNPATVTGGIWYADTTLASVPNCDFNQLITAELRFRNTSVAGNGAVFSINADWSGGTCATLTARLKLEVGGSQTLTLYHKLSNGSEAALVAVPGLSTDFVKLRLLISPSSNWVNVKVNAVDWGTYTYATPAAADNNRFATIGASSSTAEFDYVRIRVGGS